MASTTTVNRTFTPCTDMCWEGEGPSRGDEENVMPLVLCLPPGLCIHVHVGQVSAHVLRGHTIPYSRKFSCGAKFCGFRR